MFHREQQQVKVESELVNDFRTTYGIRKLSETYYYSKVTKIIVIFEFRIIYSPKN